MGTRSVLVDFGAICGTCFGVCKLNHYFEARRVRRESKYDEEGRPTRQQRRSTCIPPPPPPPPLLHQSCGLAKSALYATLLPRIIMICSIPRLVGESSAPAPASVPIAQADAVPGRPSGPGLLPSFLSQPPWASGRAPRGDPSRLAVQAGRACRRRLAGARKHRLPRPELGESLRASPSGETVANAPQSFPPL